MSDFSKLIDPLIGRSVGKLTVRLRNNGKVFSRLLVDFGQIVITPAKKADFSKCECEVKYGQNRIIIVPNFVIRRIEKNGCFMTGDCEREAREWLNIYLPKILQLIY